LRIERIILHHPFYLPPNALVAQHLMLGVTLTLQASSFGKHG
jgi:hypothetical protein